MGVLSTASLLPVSLLRPSASNIPFGVLVVCTNIGKDNLTVFIALGLEVIIARLQIMSPFPSPAAGHCDI